MLHKTSANNTICFYKGQRDSCPITGVVWDSPDSKAYPVSDWIRSSNRVEDGKTLLYTKTAIDGLPLTSFKLDQKVCINPHSKYSNPNKRLYPLEVAAEGCTPIQTPKGAYFEDYRYRKMQIPPTDEFTVESAAGVTDILRDLPMHDKLVPNSEDMKRNNEYYYWDRPTIGWNLECDAKADFERKEIAWMIDDFADLPDLIVYSYWTNVAMCVCAVFLMVYLSGYESERFVPLVTVLVTMFVLTSVEFKELKDAHDVVRVREKMHSDIAVINMCSDKLLELDVRGYATIADSTHYLLEVGFFFNSFIYLLVIVLCLISGREACIACLRGK
jgi:hypothetical protein